MPAISDYIRQALSAGGQYMQQQLTNDEAMRAERARTGQLPMSIAAPLKAGVSPSVAHQLGVAADQRMGGDQQSLRAHLAKSSEQAAGLFEDFGAPETADRIRKDPSGMTNFFHENGGAMPLLKALATSQSKRGQKVYPTQFMAVLRDEGINSPEEERIAREVLLASGLSAPDVENVIEGFRAGGPAPTMIQSGDQNVGLSPYGGIQEEIGGVPLGGRRANPTVQINTPVNIAGNALEARRQFYQEVKPLQIGLDKITQARQTLRLSRAGNSQATRALITNIEQAIQPTSAVLESEFRRTREFADLATRAENWAKQYTSGTLSDKTLNEMEETLGALEAAIHQGIEQRRAGFAPFEEGFGAEPGMVTGGVGGSTEAPEPAPTHGRVIDTITLPDGREIEVYE